MRGLDVIFSLAMMAATLQAQSSYKVIDQWKIGGEGGWDYLLADSSAHRLYVSQDGRRYNFQTVSASGEGVFIPPDSAAAARSISPATAR